VWGGKEGGGEDQTLGQSNVTQDGKENKNRVDGLGEMEYQSPNQVKGISSEKGKKMGSSGSAKGKRAQS